MLFNNDISSIDLSKFKRFFSFGCSFTSYGWPTWADVIHTNIPNADFYNFGLPGAGNQLIASRVVEANLRYTFTDTDLVMVMWSTTCREDRYKNNAWWKGGNVFRSEIYPRDFARQYADTKGYLIRDLALITQSLVFMRSLPSTCVALTMVPIDQEQDEKDVTIAPIMELYKSTTDLMLPNMLDSVMDGKWGGSMAYRDIKGNSMKDDHPRPIQYYNYLKFLGFNLSDESCAYAEASSNTLRRFTSREELFYAFPEIKESKTRLIL